MLFDVLGIIDFPNDENKKNSNQMGGKTIGTGLEISRTMSELKIVQEVCSREELAPVLFSGSTNAFAI